MNKKLFKALTSRTFIKPANSWSPLIGSLKIVEIKNINENRNLEARVEIDMSLYNVYNISTIKKQIVRYVMRKIRIYYGVTFHIVTDMSSGFRWCYDFETETYHGILSR